MADITYLPRDRGERPEPLGGPKRPDLLVELDASPRVQARRDLDERLFDAGCGIDAGDGPRVGIDDLELLLLAFGERFSGASALLRVEAVAGLGMLQDKRADAALTDLALRAVEHDAIRIAAAGALGPERGGDLLRRLAKDPTPHVSQWARHRLEGADESERIGQPAGDEDPKRCC
jgi:hypothetical protein